MFDILKTQYQQISLRRGAFMFVAFSNQLFFGSDLPTNNLFLLRRNCLKQFSVYFVILLCTSEFLTCG